MRRLLPIILIVLGGLVPTACGGGHHSTQHVYRTPSGAQRAHSRTFGLPPAGSPLVPRSTASGRTLLMLDTVDVNTFAGLNFDVAAGYTSGSWPTYYQMVGRWPHVISIAVNIYHTAQCLDVEPGDATPDQVSYWVHIDIRAGYHKPCVYTSLSEWNQVDDNLRANGIDPHSIFRWVAYWVYFPELIQGFDAQQWTDSYRSLNIDGSQVTPAFAGITPGPPPDPYLIFSKVKYPFGRFKFDAYDAARQYDAFGCEHPLRRGECLRLGREIDLLDGRLVYVAYHHPVQRHGHIVWVDTRPPDWKTGNRGPQNALLSARKHNTRRTRL